MPENQLHELLKFVVEQDASDLFLKVGAPPAIRLDGRVRFVKAQPLSEQQMEMILGGVLGDELRAAYEEKGEVDLAYEAENIGRFRVNAYKRRGADGFAFRNIPLDIPSFEDLNLPSKQLQQLTSLSRGIVLVTGVTGSGKSTTLASMLDNINSTHNKHIVTIEDPIEFVHKDKKSFVDQRELGADTHSFSAALRAAVRQSPDVILIGEMRDAETIDAAVIAAQTGHLVLSTLHTTNAVQTLQRILTYFPEHRHGLLREELSATIQGVLSQRLALRHSGSGRVPVVEIMMTSPSVRENIERGNLHELNRAIREGAHFGSQSFNQALFELISAKAISVEEGMKASEKPEELRLRLRGLRQG